VRAEFGLSYAQAGVVLGTRQLGLVVAAALVWFALARDVPRAGHGRAAGLRGVVREMRRLLHVPALRDRRVTVVGLLCSPRSPRSWSCRRPGCGCRRTAYRRPFGAQESHEC
jgi:hypothetical protein